ncbi:MAG TPA: S8 family serine peptidase, partial [Pyrinomonadaceae bacterium]|nr:S8 family serine peptidase [Pyrinomonadaceae bacterium]
MKKVFALVATLALCAMMFSPALVNTHAADDGDKKKYKADEILIQFKPGATDLDIVSARNSVGALTKKQLKRAAHAAAKGKLELASIQSGLSVEDAIQIIQAHPAVAFAEPNWVVTHQATATDTYYTNGNLWGVYGDATTPANVYGSQAGEAWAAGHTGSSGVYVGVIDEGIDPLHIDLAANIWTNPFDLPDGVDNDGNGYADDVNGWDFFQDNNTIYDGARPSDYETDLHGTHVAGTIGALSNGMGVVGVNWNVTMISAKFLGPDGGTVADAIDAIDYFVDLKSRHGLNLVAINNSWGGGGYSQALHDAVIRAAKANILFVAAAGNGGLDQRGDNNDLFASYPSNLNTLQGTSTETAAPYDSVIAVAALTSTGALAKYSNYGVTQVDIGAPGSG